jgi:hypothetical protein
MTDWKSIVKTVAPAIAAALGGPLAGAAVQALSVAIFGNPNSTEEEIAAAVLTGGTDVLFKVKQAEQDFTVKMRELEIQDLASARELAKIDSLTPRILALFITIGFFGVLYWLMEYGFPETGKDPLLIMLGSLGTAWISVVSFYFGSTAGSARKTDVLEKLIGK